MKLQKMVGLKKRDISNGTGGFLTTAVFFKQTTHYRSCKPVTRYSMVSMRLTMHCLCSVGASQNGAEFNQRE
jgi:hypothetical protein